MPTNFILYDDNSGDRIRTLSRYFTWRSGSSVYSPGTNCNNYILTKLEGSHYFLLIIKPSGYNAPKHRQRVFASFLVVLNERNNKVLPQTNNNITIFFKFFRTLPWSSVLRIWDMFLCEGVKVLFRVALVLIKYSLPHKVRRKCPSKFIKG